MNIQLSPQDQDLLQHNWTGLASKHITYAKASIGGKQSLLHRFVAQRMGLSLDGVIDHINGDALDCRRENLQACTHQQNIMKQRHQATAKSPYKGVMQFRDKWRSRITINGKTMHLGLFANAVDAARAYNEKAKELFGDFANLNEVNHVPTTT
jgi:hypothetical protein